MRLFAAIELPQSIRPHFEAMQFKLRGSGLVRARSPHITLKFIGDVADAQPVIDALSSITFAPFELVTHELGFFPSVSNPRVLFLGVKPHAQLDDLAAQVRAALPMNADHPFHAHITLFRLRMGFHKARLKDLVSQVKFKELRFSVNSFVLKSSVLTQNGPVHSTIFTFPAKDL